MGSRRNRLTANPARLSADGRCLGKQLRIKIGFIARFRLLDHADARPPSPGLKPYPSSARTEAMLNGMSDDPMVRYVTSYDEGHAYESAFIDGRGPGTDATIRIDRGGPDPRISAVDFRNGKVTEYIAGKASDDDHAELRVADRLVSRLNELGANWHDLELLRASAHDERGIDCTARDDAGKVLLIQVTRADQTAWGPLHRTPSITREQTIADLVEAIRAAITHKKTRATSDIVLALDATDSPGSALREVVDSFRRQHGEWAATIGFREIWLVGPVNALVLRAHSPLRQCP